MLNMEKVGMTANKLFNLIITAVEEARAKPFNSELCLLAFMRIFYQDKQICKLRNIKPLSDLELKNLIEKIKSLKIS